MKFQVLPFENWTWWRHLSTTHKDASNKGHTRARPSIRRTTLPPSSLLFSALSLAAYSSARTTFFRNVAKWEILQIVILKNQLPHKVECPLSLSLSSAACRIARNISGVSNDKRMFTRVRTHPEWTGCRPEHYTDISRKSRTRRRQLNGFTQAFAGSIGQFINDGREF